MSEKTEPELRFKVFSGAWPNHSFGELVNRKTRVVLDDTLPKVEYEDIDSGFGTLNKELREKQSRKSGVEFQPGDVLFGKLRPYLRNWLRPEFRGIAVGDFWTLQGNRCDSEFLYSLIQGDRFTYISNISSGSKMPRSDWGIVSQTPFRIPESPDEQHQIGTLFSKLDNLISQHRRKHEKLQQTKAALMQQIFPRDGADEPELRFEGFSGAWVDSVLNERVSFGKGQGYSKADLKENGTPLFLYGRIYTKFEIAVTNLDTFAIKRPGSVVSIGNEILVPSSGETAEDISIASALLQPGVLIGGDLNIIHPDDELDSVFLALRIGAGSVKSSLTQRAQGKSVVHLRNSDLHDLRFGIPEPSEQRQIGTLFSKIDTLISAERTYIDKLQQVKTALLQKMFI